MEALWRRAFDVGTLVPIYEYAPSSTFEDPIDRRTAKEKYNWWGMYLEERKAQRLFVPEVLEARLARYFATMKSTEIMREQRDSRREAHVAAKEAVVDLVTDRSESEEDDRACSSAVGIDVSENSKRAKRKSRGGRYEGAESKSRGKKARKLELETDRDDVPRFLRPDRVGRPITEYAASYDQVANKVQLEAMRAVGTVFGPEGRLQCLGSAALFSKEELTMGTDYAVDEARADDHSAACWSAGYYFRKYQPLEVVD